MPTTVCNEDLFEDTVSNRIAFCVSVNVAVQLDPGDIHDKCMVDCACM
jgi:Flp pilus assembly protein protease CpaA